MNEVFMSMKHSVLLKPNPAWKDRFVRLDRLENMILENKERIETAIYTDFGCRDAFVTDMLDIFPDPLSDPIFEEECRKMDEASLLCPGSVFASGK